MNAPAAPVLLRGSGRCISPQLCFPCCPVPTAFYDYRLYGLAVRSELFLWGLPPARFATPDVTVHRAPVDAPRPVQDGCFYADAERILVGRRGLVVMEARGGTELRVHPLSAPDDPMVEAVLIGQGMAAVLHQRGVFTLHASAAAIRGGVAGFLGARRAGKSTTAAAMRQRGHPLFTDDLLALEAAGTEAAGTASVMARPGPALLKLRPDAAAAWPPDGPATDLEPVGKRLWSVADGAPARLPLRALFLLTFGERLRADRLPPREAFVVVTNNAFTSAAAPATGQTASFFRLQAAVADVVPVFRLARPRALNRLEAVVALIEATVASKV